MTVKIVNYKWAGNWLFFRIETNCSECDLTTTILKNMVQKEFKGKDVSFEIKPWLNSILYCLVRGAWHAPIVMVDGGLFHQYSKEKPLFDRKKLVTFVEARLK